MKYLQPILIFLLIAYQVLNYLDSKSVISDIIEGQKKAEKDYLEFKRRNELVIDSLKSVRAKDSIKIILLQKKINQDVNVLHKKIEDYRRKLIDLGDLPIY